jgi:hypothetical protein
MEKHKNVKKKLESKKQETLKSEDTSNSIGSVREHKNELKFDDELFTN